MDAFVDTFHDSLGRCLAEPHFLDRFYERFLASSEEVSRLFQATDFEKQRRMLKASFYLIMLASQGSLEGLKHLEQIAERHSRRALDVPPVHYEAWLRCLLETVREFDPMFKPEVEAAWRRMMEPGIALMVKRYEQPVGDSGSGR
ncbi:MAG: globin [Planctomycetes bacterium]|nr:globin [Planctomycetota bacterium]